VLALEFNQRTDETTHAKTLETESNKTPLQVPKYTRSTISTYLSTHVLKYSSFGALKHRRNFRGDGGPDPHFLEWGTDPPLSKYTSSLVPHFSDQSYAIALKHNTNGTIVVISEFQWQYVRLCTRNARVRVHKCSSNFADILVLFSQSVFPISTDCVVISQEENCMWPNDLSLVARTIAGALSPSLLCTSSCTWICIPSFSTRFLIQAFFSHSLLPRPCGFTIQCLFGNIVIASF